MSEAPEKPPPPWHRPGKVGRKINRPALTTLGGVISELARCYRAFKSGKINGEQARTRAYLLDRLRAALEAKELGELQQRLNELETRAESRGLGNGGQPLRLAAQ